MSAADPIELRRLFDTSVSGPLASPSWARRVESWPRELVRGRASVGLEDLRRAVAEPSTTALWTWYDEAGHSHVRRLLGGQLDEALHKRGTVCVKQLERTCAPIARLIEELEARWLIPGQVQVNAYASTDTAGFRLHIDRWHGVVIQLAGAKCWRYSCAPAIVDPSAPAKLDAAGEVVCSSSMPRPAAVGIDELASITLAPGDALSVPAGCWHAASAVGHSLALTLTFKRPSFAELMPALAPAAHAQLQPWRQAFPIAPRNAHDELPVSVRARMEDFVTTLVPELGARVELELERHWWALTRAGRSQGEPADAQQTDWRLLAIAELHGPNIHRRESVLACELELSQGPLAQSTRARLRELYPGLGPAQTPSAALLSVLAQVNPEPAELELESISARDGWQRARLISTSLDHEVTTGLVRGAVAILHAAATQHDWSTPHWRETTQQLTAWARARLPGPGVRALHARAGELPILRVDRGPLPSLAALAREADARGVELFRVHDAPLDAGDSLYQLGLGRDQRRVNGGTVELLHALGGGDGSTLDSLLPGPYATIPVVTITGTNGKTTTCRLVARILDHAGLRVGLTTSSDVRIAGELVLEGELNGAIPARLLLHRRDIDVAVLEAGRGSLLRDGLGYDRVDVGVCLNLGDDHIGHRGIETLDDLARVKAIPVLAARKAAVVDGDDPRCVAMASVSSAERVYVVSRRGLGREAFAELDVREWVLCRVEDGIIELVGVEDRTSIARVDELPMTYGGHARHNLQNALAAVATADALGLEAAVIAGALASFMPSFEDCAGRLNQYWRGGVQVVLDYAHNPEGMAALADFSASLPVSGRRIVVFTVRRDFGASSRARMLASLARVFDHFVCRASALALECPEARATGLPADAVVAALREGLIAQGITPDAVTTIADEHAAVAAALELAVPGDLVVVLAKSVTACWRQIIGDAAARPDGC